MYSKPKGLDNLKFKSMHRVGHECMLKPNHDHLTKNYMYTYSICTVM